MEYPLSRARHGYAYRASGCTGFFAAEALDQKGVIHGFSTRLGGVSPAPYDSLNLGWTRPDPPDNVSKNFQIFCNAGGFAHGDMVIVNYEHGGTVLKVTAEDRGRGFERPPLSFCDGLVTNEKNVVLVTSHADCGAFFIYDPVKGAVGLAHAGWKGTLARIGARAVELMQREFGSDAGDLIVSTGPSICKSCFEVDLELAERFAAEFKTNALFTRGRPGKAQLDLELAAAIQMLEAGVKEENLTLMHACTSELDRYFFSHRRDKGDTGSMAAYIGLI